MLGVAATFDVAERRLMQVQDGAQLVDRVSQAPFAGDHRPLRAHDGQGQEAAVAALDLPLKVLVWADDPRRRSATPRRVRSLPATG